MTAEKKTLVLDLDETLIHCNESLSEPYDHLLNIKFADGEIVDVRPLDSRQASYCVRT